MTDSATLQKNGRTNMLIIILSILIVTACGIEQSTPQCPTVEAGSLQMTDLTGTWIAEHVSEPRVRDTLEIRGDGTYRQIIRMDVPDVDYESDWHSWRMEIDNNGLLYLYLEGLSLCAFNGRADCVSSGGGTVYNPCRQVTVRMPDNDVMLLLANDDLVYIASPTSGWHYIRVEP